MNVTDAQTLSFVQGQFYNITNQVYEARYPSLDYGRLIYVDESGPEWAPGTMTYTSDQSGRAQWQSGYAKDVPLADVSQDMQLSSNYMASIGYQWNIEEVNGAMGFPGASLPDRRARAARRAYEQFIFDLVVTGDEEKGKGGLINYPGVPTTSIPADGTGSVTYWVDSAGVGQKTPAQIVRDINLVLQGISVATFRTEMADTILLPVEAYNYIASTPYSATTMETILSFVQRTNTYTMQTGNPITIRTVPELSTGSANGTEGRMVAYRNEPDYVKLHLPMRFRFLGVYQDGPLNWVVPGIFRTGGVELLTTAAFRYADGISQPAATP